MGDQQEDKMLKDPIKDVVENRLKDYCDHDYTPLGIDEKLWSYYPNLIEFHIHINGKYMDFSKHYYIKGDIYVLSGSGWSGGTSFGIDEEWLRDPQSWVATYATEYTYSGYEPEINMVIKDLEGKSNDSN